LMAGPLLRVAVLMGGSSEERSVSLASGAQVSAALRQAGHEVISIDSAVGILSPDVEERLLKSPIGSVELPLPRPTSRNTLPDAGVISKEEALQEVDVVFLALHGGGGEDGTIQTLLDVAGVPYAGSGPVGCALAMDKDLTKRLLRDAGMATPEWILGRTPGEDVLRRLGSPVIVKPAQGGSSVRLTLASDAAAVDQATAAALGGGDEVMYEAYVKGREFTVGILDGRPLPVVEIIPSHELFDFECKYVDGMAQEIVPADIDDELRRNMQRLALEVHQTLRLRHFSRVDFMVDEAGGIHCLEANALPGLTANSLLPKAARAAGIEFPELCDRICRLGVLQVGAPGDGTGSVRRG